MSAEQVAAAAERQVFRPRKQFAQLAYDHVPFDQLLGTSAYEARALQLLTSGERRCVSVPGPIGAGKSSLMASVCAQIPNDHVALRVPIVGADDPTRVTEVAAMTLTTALAAIDMEDHERAALEGARADERGETRGRPGIKGGKLGGGVIPAEINLELESLREEHRTHALAGDRLYGIDRLISILIAGGREPVFVLEDTEAAIGGDSDARVEAFFTGPVRAFMQEIDAALFIAIQVHLLEDCRAYQELRPGMVEVAIPELDSDQAHATITTIANHRLRSHELEFDASAILTKDGLDEVVAAFQDRFGRSLRHTLVVLQGAADVAADVSSEAISAAHVREAVQDWPAVPR